MAGDRPTKSYTPLAFGGVLDESKTPKKTGAGLVACNNLTYRRSGGWAKRSGSAPVYNFPVALAPVPAGPTSGVRWRRAVPITNPPFVQTVVVSQGEIYTASDPSASVPPTLTPIFSASAASSTPSFFATARDPAESSVAGNPESDILIITGLTSNFGFASGQITFSLSAGASLTGITATVNFTQPGYPTASVSYTGTATDTIGTFMQNLVAAINAAYPVVGKDIFLHTPYISIVSATASNLGVGAIGAGFLTVTALAGGGTGNNIQISASTSGGAGLTASPTASTNLTGGGSTFSGPLKYDGTNVTALSPQIQNAFTGCVAWHNHVFFWGDPNNPDTVFASDINAPEGFTFMAQYGGYDIGVGDGDPTVQNCVPIGDSLYVFKRNSVYAIRGYDFQSGEYQFSVTIITTEAGIPSPLCVAVLRNALVYWSGSKFVRLAIGSFDPEYIGVTIPLTSGKVANGNNRLIRAVAGDFQYATLLNNTYEGYPVSGTEILQNTALFAVDIGSGYADTVLVYDDDASQAMGNYAWSVWTGWQVACWIALANGTSETLQPSRTPTSAISRDGYSPNLVEDDPVVLLFVPTSGTTINQFGANGGQDSGSAIAFLARTGWMDFDTPALTKDVHNIFLDVESINGVNISLELLTRGSVLLPNVSAYPSRTIAYPATIAPLGDESFQELSKRVNPFLRGNVFQMTFTEGALNTSFELIGATVAYIENPFNL